MNLNDREQRMLEALAWMAVQYLGPRYPDLYGELDSLSMTAGEETLELLSEHGLVTITREGRCGVWTEKGLELLQAH